VLAGIFVLNPDPWTLVPKKGKEMDCNRFRLNVFLSGFMAAKMIIPFACGAVAGPSAARSAPVRPSP